MGLFDGDMAIDVAVSGSRFLPGDSIAARVTVGGKGDAKVRGARLELAYDNHYYEHEYRSGADGSGYYAETVSSDTVVIASVPVAGGDRHDAVAPGAYDVVVALPADAPPTVEDWVDWKVTAVLDRRRAIDEDHEVPITVLAPPGLYAEWTDRDQVSEGDCDMRLELPARSVRAGETLSGVLHVRPNRPFAARSVRVQLQHHMLHTEDDIKKPVRPRASTLAEAMQLVSGEGPRLPLGLGDSADAVVALAGETEFAPGHAHRFPFQIAVPTDAPPTLRARYNEVHWHLAGVCDRKFRGDYAVQAELQVYNAEPRSPGDNARRASDPRAVTGRAADGGWPAPAARAIRPAGPWRR